MSHSTQTQTKTEIRLEPKVTPEMLIELRRRLGQSLTDFGETLRNAQDKKHRDKGPYSRKTISALEHGRIPITKEIVGAYYEIEGRSKSIPAGTAGAVLSRVLAQPGQIPDGTFVKESLEVKNCKAPWCNIDFIGPGEYHAHQCRIDYRNFRRRNGNK